MKESDVLVIGGGAIGLAIADRLLLSGCNVTVVFPKDADKEAASRAAGAMLGAFGEVTSDDTEAQITELEFRLRAQRMYPDWLKNIAERSDRTIFQAKGTYVIANNFGVDDRNSIKRMESEAKRLDEPAHWVEPEEIPGLNPNPSYAPGLCLYLPNEHSVDSEQLMDTLFNLVTNHENCKYIDSHVVSVESKGDCWQIKTVDGASIQCAKVVLAAGSRSFEILDKELRDAAGLPKLFFGRGVSYIVRGLPEIKHTIRTPNRAFACGAHVVPRNGLGVVYVGATNTMGFHHEEEAGIQPAELHTLFDDTIHQICTDIRTARIEQIRVGYRPITSTREPVIGKTKLDGMFVATGTYRNGVLMAPLVASIIANDMGLGTLSGCHINPFSITRSQAKIEEIDWDCLTSIGVRDTIRFIQEPHGHLPYNRAKELEQYIKRLYDLILNDGSAETELKHEIRSLLSAAPYSETMHQLYYKLISKENN
jgi:glycine oxidase